VVNTKTGGMESPSSTTTTTTVNTTTTQESKSPGRTSKNYPSSKKKLTPNGKFEKNGRVVPVNIRQLRLAPPGMNKSESENDSAFYLKSNSFPSSLSFSPRDQLYNDPETPRKIASSPVISSYTDLFQTKVHFDPTTSVTNQPEVFGESKFVSLFSQPPSADICGEMKLKPFISLDFIEDQPPYSPKTTPSKLPLSVTPKTPEPSEKSPYRNSKTPQKSPRNRPVSPLDDQRLVQRQKQIDYGYRTVGYLRYRLLVPKDMRKPDHPRTPKKAQGCSKRSWDGQLKKWRRDLHLWDPDNLEAFRALLSSEVVETLVAANPELEDVVRAVREKLDNPSSLKNLEDGDISDDDLEPSTPATIATKSSSKNQVISSGPKLTNTKVARTLVF
jgi:hypothetical protein